MEKIAFRATHGVRCCPSFIDEGFDYEISNKEKSMRLKLQKMSWKQTNGQFYKKPTVEQSSDYDFEVVRQSSAIQPKHWVRSRRHGC